MAVEFPDQDIINFLKRYGQLKSENLCRLCYNKDGFRNIKRGICVAEFTLLDRDLPRKMVTQGLEIFFKYTGQPITCYRCGSTDHVVKNCPKQRARFGHLCVEDRVLPGLPNPRKPVRLKWTAQVFFLTLRSRRTPRVHRSRLSLHRPSRFLLCPAISSGSQARHRINGHHPPPKSQATRSLKGPQLPLANLKQPQNLAAKPLRLKL